MNLIENCQNSKLTLIAMNKFVQQCAADTQLDLSGPLSVACEQAGVNRSQVYERQKQIKEVLKQATLPGPGHPARPAIGNFIRMEKGICLHMQILQYRVDHPSALISHKEYTTYSNGFIRFILDLADQWEDSLELFCQHAHLPYQTVRSWRKKDLDQPYRPHSIRQYLPVDDAGEDARRIAEDYSNWEGSLRDFLKYEARRMNLAPAAIRRVLVIFCMLPAKSAKHPRYRGATRQCQPGNVLVTDGKTVDVVCTASRQLNSYNWQGIVDQATTCHTAVIVNNIESASGVREAFDDSCNFIGRAPRALVHDNKPIHDEAQLRKHIEKTTLMIPTTANRGQNKACIEGEFGKFEQTVGAIVLDDSSEQALKQSAVHEVLRAYTAGINHAGRAEFDGQSRQQVLRQACPDPDKDQQFIEQLHADHTAKRRTDALSSRLASLALLNDGFSRFAIADLDPKGEVRQWIASRYTLEAIRHGLAIFGTEYNKGRLRNKTAHRYLVKVIQNCQDEIDLRLQEELLREYAGVERSFWIKQLEADHQLLVSECDHSSPETDLLLRLSDNAVFGGLILQRAFWEKKLKKLIEKHRDRFAAVCNHVRRLFEAKWEHRFALISKLINWEYQLAQ